MDYFGKDSLGSLLFQVIRLHHARAFALLGKIGIYRGQPPVLKLLWEKDGRNQKELAEFLHLKPATITDILHRMEKAQLLERRPDPEDLRVSRVYLTEKGKKIRKDLEMVLNTIEEECFYGFTPEEKKLLRQFFIKIRDNLLKVTEYSCKRGEWHC